MEGFCIYWDILPGRIHNCILMTLGWRQDWSLGVKWFATRKHSRNSQVRCKNAFNGIQSLMLLLIYGWLVFDVINLMIRVKGINTRLSTPPPCSQWMRRHIYVAHTFNQSNSIWKHVQTQSHTRIPMIQRVRQSTIRLAYVGRHSSVT